MIDVVSGVGLLRIEEKSRGKKSDGSHSSPRTKKKPNSKAKKHSGGDDVIDESLRLSQDSQLNRSTSGRQGSANGRRHTSSDVQHSETTGKHSGKVTKGKDGRKGASESREDDAEILRSGDESTRNSPMTGRHNVRTTRMDSEENGKDPLRNCSKVDW